MGPVAFKLHNIGISAARPLHHAHRCSFCNLAFQSSCACNHTGPPGSAASATSACGPSPEQRLGCAPVSLLRQALQAITSWCSGLPALLRLHCCAELCRRFVTQKYAGRQTCLYRSAVSLCNSTDGKGPKLICPGASKAFLWLQERTLAGVTSTCVAREHARAAVEPKPSKI